MSHCCKRDSCLQIDRSTQRWVDPFTVLVRSLGCDSSLAAPLWVAHKPHLGMHGRLLAQCTLA
jgi:hypothetical protein